MNKVAKIFSYIAFVFAFCCMAIGYAAVQDTLLVDGIVSVDGYIFKYDFSAEDTEGYTLSADGKLEIKEIYYDPNAVNLNNNRVGVNYRVVTIADNGFSSYENKGGVTTLVLPDSVHKVGENAFSDFTKLSEVQFGSGFTEIRPSSFNTTYETEEGVTITVKMDVPENSLVVCNQLGVDISKYVTNNTSYTIELNAKDSADQPVVTAYSGDAAGVYDYVAVTNGEFEVANNQKLVDLLSTTQYTYAALEADGALKIRNGYACVVENDAMLVDAGGTHTLGAEGAVYKLPCEVLNANPLPENARMDWEKLRSAYGKDEKGNTICIFESPVKSVAVDDNLALKGSLAGIFYEFTNTETIDLRKATFDNVTNMQSMFENCRAAESILFDSNTLNTQNVTTMKRMFYYCQGLTSLDLKGFDTANVTTMERMFYYCSRLSSADFSSFNTSKLRSMEYMFDSCAFTELNLSSFDTRKLTTLYAAFVRCRNMEKLWFTNLCGASANIGFMFQNCEKLKTIYSRDNWDIPQSSLFSDSPNLVGGNGNKYNSQYQSSDYAWIDNDSGRPGYLTYVGDPLLRCCITDVSVSGALNSNGTSVEVTLTASNGTLPSGVRIISSLEGVADYITTIENDKVTIPKEFCTKDQVVSLFPYGDDVTYTFAVLDGTTLKVYKRDHVTIKGTKVTIADIEGEMDASQFYAIPVSVSGSYDITSRSWHNAIDQATKIEFMDEITPVGSIDGLFIDFKKVTEISLIDASGNLLLNTANVTTMKNMFQNCAALIQINGIDLLNTSKVTNMSNLFTDCKSMQKFDFLAKLDTSKVEKMSGMFSGCTALTEFTVPAMNTSSVNDMSGMFNGCSGLTKLVFPKSFDTSNVTSMEDMFKNCTKLQEIDLSTFNTAKVTTMRLMFRGCSSLTELDLSGFDTSKVEDFYGTFAYDAKLQTIYVSDKWNNSAVKGSAYMFENCPALKGGNDTTLKSVQDSGVSVSDSYTVTYARIDGKDGQPGYFTAPEHEHRFATDTVWTTNDDETCIGACDAYGEPVSTSHTLNANNICTKCGYGKQVYAVYDSADKSLRFYRQETVPESSGTQTVYTDFIDKDYTGIYLIPWSSVVQSIEIVEVVDYGIQPVSMSYWFADFTAMKSCDVSKLDTSKVKSFSYTFSNCISIDVLDLSTWNTKSATDMTEMFAQWNVYYENAQTLLKTIYVDSALWNMSKVISKNDMFLYCKSLVGGLNTGYDASRVNGDYARIDGGVGNEGYFTEKPAE